MNRENHYSIVCKITGKTTLTEDSACQRIRLHSISCFDCGDWRNCNKAFVDSAHVYLVKLWFMVMVHASTWRSFPGKSKQRCQGYERYKRRRIGEDRPPGYRLPRSASNAFDYKSFEPHALRFVSPETFDLYTDNRLACYHV